MAHRDRLIRSGIVNSARINALSDPAQIFFRNLLHYVDDYGRCRYLPKVLLGTLCAMRSKGETDADVMRWVEQFVKLGLVKKYSVADEEFLEIDNFGQRLRAMTSKYPSPEGDGPCPGCGAPIIRGKYRETANDSRLNPAAKGTSG